MSTVKLQSREDISAAIYRALVEVFTLQNAGLEPVVKTTVGGDWGVQALSGAKIVQLGDGAVKVDYASEDLREELITVLTSVPEVEAGTLEGEGAVEKESLQESEIGTQNEDVPSQEEQANATEAQEEDVFEPEDPAGDDVAAAVTDTQMGAPVEASKKRAAWLALLDHVPAEQWIKITFADPSVKFAVSYFPLDFISILWMQDLRFIDRQESNAAHGSSYTGRCASGHQLRQVTLRPFGYQAKTKEACRASDAQRAALRTPECAAKAEEVDANR